MNCNNLMAIRIENREASAVKIQQVLTKHGCKIRMRLGIHDQDDPNVCSLSGTLIVQLCCTAEEGRAVEADLVKIDGVKAKFVNFE